NDGGQKFDNTDFLHDGIYETMNLGPFTVEAVPAGGNPNHDVKYCVGYLVTVDGVTIYHAGDTSMIDQMKDLQSRDIDYAMYPIDGVFNMDAKEATEVATLVGAKNNIPIHEFDQNGSKKSDNFTPEGRLVLEYGQTIEIGK
ncbi:MAG: MBL fold metallo-hydrolase, partial [Clostridiales bacterium]|nr:MBL fold metallo-hydrolase [Clostridiales bacterium]